LKQATRALGRMLPGTAVDLVRRAILQTRQLPRAGAQVWLRTWASLLKELVDRLGKSAVEEHFDFVPKETLPLLPPPIVTMPFTSLILEFELFSSASAAAKLPSAADRVQITTKILEVYEKIRSTSKNPRAFEDVNNRFFAHQQRQFELSGRTRTFMHDLPGFRGLELAARAAVVELIKKASSLPADEAQRRAGRALFPFASVHGPASTHGVHFHCMASVSGVYYLRAPSGAARLVFHDPRGTSFMLQEGWDAHSSPRLPVPPFHKSFSIQVREGVMVVFPSWLPHEVETNAVEEGNYRVSISFNLDGDWHDTSSTVIRKPVLETQTVESDGHSCNRQEL